MNEATESGYNFGMGDVDADRIKAVLRAGDEMLKAGDSSGALRAYVEVARWFEGAELPLKAIAVWKQIREVIQRDAQHETVLDAEARKALIGLFRSIGLESDAQAVQAEEKAPSRLNSAVGAFAK